MSDSYAEYLYMALAEPYGLALTVVNPTAVRAKLYEVRKTDPDLARLVIRQSPIAPDTELWIVHKKEAASGKAKAG